MTYFEYSSSLVGGRCSGSCGYNEAI
jgi:hypothetical protein